MNNAISYAEKRVTCLEKLPRTDEVQKRIIDARTALGVHLLRLLHYAKAKEAVEPIIDVALKAEDKRRLTQILIP